MAKKKVNNIKTKICKQCNIEKDINEFKTNSKTKDGHVSICRNCMTEKIINTRKNNDHTYYYIYRFLDKDDNIIYVGKTTNIHQRIFGHISKATSFGQTENQFLMYPNVYKIEYCEVLSDYHMNIYEMHYICKYNPPFNINYKTNNQQLFNLPELKWNLYFFNSFIKDNIEFYYRIVENKNINAKDELKNNLDFYNQWADIYSKSYYTYRQFNPDFFDDYFCGDEEEIIIDDELDFCKFHCDHCIGYEEDLHEPCNKKVTWRDIYNQRILESKKINDFYCV